MIAAKTIRSLFFILAALAAPHSYGAVSRTIDADVLKSADHSKTWTPPSATDTLVGRASTDTLTNKSISGSSNTLSNLPASALSGTVAVANQTITAQAISGTNIDWSTGSLFTQTLSTNRVFTFSNATSGQRINVRLTNTGSNYTVAWPSVNWSGGTSPTMTTGAKSDIYTFFYDGTNYYGSVVQNLSMGFPSISGCDSLTTDGDFKVCTFNNSGTAVVTGSGAMDMLLVAGGGGSTTINGGGGGAGGVLYLTGQMVGGGSYPVVVGAGGVGSAVTDPTNGGDSTFNGQTAVGGGAGAGFSSDFGRNGGSGGGGGISSSHAGGTGVSGQGNAGGSGGQGSPFPTGGGGGAGSVGGNASSGSQTAGNGGNGVSNSITGSPVTYGGGGGGATSGGSVGTGGTGGGGTGGFQGVSNCTNGTNGLGGGAGGAGSTGDHCNGGSGRVIIRYEFQ